MTLRPEPLFVLGTGREPLSLLPLLYRIGFHGACVASARGLTARMLLTGGQIVHAELPDHADALGHVLHDLGLLDLQTYGETMRQARAEQKKHGEILLELKIIDELRLYHALSVQLGRKLRRILGAPGVVLTPGSSAHGFGTDERERRILPNPRQVVYLAARLSAPAIIEDVLEPLQGQKLFVPAERKTLLVRYGFGEQATAATQQLVAAPHTLDELPGTPEVRAAIAALVATEVVEQVESESRDPKSARRTREVPPDELLPEEMLHAGEHELSPPSSVVRSPAALEAARELRGRLDRVDRQTLWEVLDLDRRADAEQIGAAYLMLRRRFEPQRIAALGLDELVAESDSFCARLDEARAMLGDAAARARYEALLDKKVPPQRAERLIGAERAFQRGQQALARGDFAGALEALGASVRGNDLEPTYEATLTWARYLADLDRGEAPRATAEEATRRLMRTIQQWPSSVRAFLYLARVLAAEGDFERAASTLRRALRNAPDDVELLRELRWCERRVQSRSTLGRR